VLREVQALSTRSISVRYYDYTSIQSAPPHSRTLYLMPPWSPREAWEAGWGSYFTRRKLRLRKVERLSCKGVPSDSHPATSRVTNHHREPPGT